MQRATNWIMMVSYFHACVLCRPDIQAHSVWLAISMPLSLARPMLPLCMHCHSACDPEPHRMRCTHTHTHTQLIQFQLIAILRIRRATCGLWGVRTRDVRGVHDNHYNGHCCASSPQKHHAARAYGERCWHCFCRVSLVRTCARATRAAVHRSRQRKGCRAMVIDDTAYMTRYVCLSNAAALLQPFRGGFFVVWKCVAPFILFSFKFHISYVVSCWPPHGYGTWNGGSGFFFGVCMTNTLCPKCRN